MLIETLDDLVKLNGFKKIIRFLKSNGVFYEFQKEFKPHFMSLPSTCTIYDFFANADNSFEFHKSKKGSLWWCDKIFNNNKFNEISHDLIAK